MYWTLELASKLEDAPWPASKDELIDYAQRSGAPLEVIENLQEMEDEGEIYECMEDIWPDYPSKEDFFFNEEEYYRLTQIVRTDDWQSKKSITELGTRWWVRKRSFYLVAFLAYT